MILVIHVIYVIVYDSFIYTTLNSKGYVMRKQVYIFSLLFLSILSQNSEATGLLLDGKNVRASESLGKVKLFHSNKNGFLLKENGNLHRIPNSSLSPELRSRTNQQLAAFQKAGYIAVNKQSDGQFSLKSHVRGEAGGAGGAWLGAVIGKFVVHGVVQAGILVATAGVAIVCPPAAAPFFSAAQLSVVPAVEGAANVVALGVGILGAVATGPV